MYFLLIAYMQTIKSISISNGKSVMAIPLSIIVFVSMLKDAFEDYKRSKSDNEENSNVSLVYSPEKNDFELRPWKDIKPGQIVKVLEDQFIPADLITI